MGNRNLLHAGGLHMNDVINVLDASFNNFRAVGWLANN